MPKTPPLKVYAPWGDFVAACHDVSDALAVLDRYGIGAEIRASDHRRVLWHEDGSTIDREQYISHVLRRLGQ